MAIPIPIFAEVTVEYDPIGEAAAGAIVLMFVVVLLVLAIVFIWLNFRRSARYLKRLEDHMRRAEDHMNRVEYHLDRIVSQLESKRPNEPDHLDKVKAPRQNA